MQNNKAFTLIELSIVIVIIGLIIGGALVGRDLIRAAEYRNITSEFSKLQQSILTYRLKYNNYPGDDPQATNFFGLAGGTGLVTDGACFNAAAAGLGSNGTCNGDGNRRIGISDNWGNYERFFIWQHLNLAELLETTIDPRGQGGTGYGHHRNVNVPPSAFDKGMWAVHLVADPSVRAGNVFYDGVANKLAGKHVLVLGRDFQPTGTYWSWPHGFISPFEARLIDGKTDDGMPFTGHITSTPRSVKFGEGASLFGCTKNTPDKSITQTYRETEDKNCVLVFEMQAL